jgi:hypothetical protein
MDLSGQREVLPDPYMQGHPLMNFRGVEYSLRDHGKITKREKRKYGMLNPLHLKIFSDEVGAPIL